MAEMTAAQKKSQNLAVIEKDFCSFFDYCKENGFTPEEMRQICKPLAVLVVKTKLQNWLRYITYFAIFAAFLYYFVHLESVSWHASALGRIAMIKLLPFWDWRHLANEKCLLKNTVTTNKDVNFNCVLCEALEDIPSRSNVDPEVLNDAYLKVHVPVIITDGLDDWPSQDDEFNMTESLLNDRIIKWSFPCELSTNVLAETVEVKDVLERLPSFRNWFFHLQNCEVGAVKAFRAIAPRPYFLEAEISPVQFSWILMSSRYKAPRYKTINLRERYTVVAQIRGSNWVRLLPRKNCAGECRVLERELKIGQALLFSSLWDFEYKPKEDSDNVAVILEMN